MTVHVNNEQSRNCCSSRGLNVFAVEVPARTKMVKMCFIKHIMTMTNVPIKALISVKPSKTTMMKTCVSCLVGMPTCPTSEREAGLDL